MKSFLSGRSQVHAPALQALNTPAGSAEAGARVAGHTHAGAKGQVGGPNVECIRQGDKVVKLIVTCSCGERIEIDCLYPAGG